MMPDIVRLRSTTGAGYVDFPQCAVDGDLQKWTTLVFSAKLAASLSQLRKLGCLHSSHARGAAGQDHTGGSKSRAAAEFPPKLNRLFLSAAVASLVISPLPPSTQYEGLRVGSARRYATDQPSDGRTAGPRMAVPSASLRRLDPERPDVLGLERPSRQPTTLRPRRGRSLGRTRHPYRALFNQ